MYQWDLCSFFICPNKNVFKNILYFLVELSRNASRNEDMIDEEEEKNLKNQFDDVTVSSSQHFENSGSKKEFRLVRLREQHEDEREPKTLGIFIARVRESQQGTSQSIESVTCAAYYIAHILHDGLVWR
jgi:hypothetical protein